MCVKTVFSPLNETFMIRMLHVKIGSEISIFCRLSILEIMSMHYLSHYRIINFYVLVIFHIACDNNKLYKLNPLVK